MNTLVKKSTIAVAVSVILGSSAALAVEPSSEINTFNDTYVSLEKDVSVYKDLDLEGTVELSGKIVVNANAMAVVDDKQLNYDNELNTDSVGDPNFDAILGTVDGNAGNLGINVTSGAFNQQDNGAAIAAIDNSFLHGSTDAEIFSHQKLWKTEDTGTGGISTNDTGLTLNGPQFDASIAGVTNNAGNVGVNVSAGVSNQQKNNLAISSGVSKLAEATSAALQEVSGQTVTLNTIAPDGVGGAGVGIDFMATLADVSGNAGNVGVNVASGIYNQQANSLSIASTN